MAGALVAHMEGRGHACLLLDELLGDPDALLGWPAEAQTALHAAMASLHTDPGAWTETLKQARSVGAGDAPSSAPLVLHEGRLYLRRYWDYERRVATQVLARGATPLPVDTMAVRRQLDLLFPAGGARRIGPRLAEGRVRPRAARPLLDHHRRPGHRQDLHRCAPARLALAMDASPDAPARDAGRAHRQGGGAARSSRSMRRSMR